MKKLETYKRLIQIAMSSICIGMQMAIYALFWYGYYSERMYLKFYFKGHLLMLFVYVVLLFFFSQMYGGMRIGYLRYGEVMFSQVFATVCVNAITYLQMCLMVRGFLDIRPMLYMTLSEAAVIVLWTMGSAGIYRRIFSPRNLLLVHGDRPVEDILQKFATRKDKYQVTKNIHIGMGAEAICQEAENGYDGLILWDIPAQIRNRLYKYCFGVGIRVYIMPKIPDILIKGADQLHLFDTPILLTREYVLSFDQRLAKRIIDFVCALILCIISSPIMLVTAILIKAYDQGPVLYKQVRCTRDMKEFHILKFRSMRVDAEKDGVARLASKNDDRITPIGRFIRMVRIDELPQLFNILKGDMTFIGPRPERPEIIMQYMENMPEFIFRTKVKAGLAGYAQVYGKYNTTPYDKLKLDLFYIENYSIWLDIKLMLLTLKILFRPESTEGVDNSQTTALKK
ncbi:MAG: exopolysaccharide biosynthesis polyprenyl glycosylphosphotransferase [Lachnospiraceae bacterium]|jgi:exopolysaccharide biosynthesis polyprenyl glycosylphosphotransferase|nr:exopolysaccharide biosynthesis polyprenyl glycosylphosphotransferase [Lachnospiraceae bacterium]